MADRIDALIDETLEWRSFHRGERDAAGVARYARSGHGIEASACAIRLKALIDCLTIVDPARGAAAALRARAGARA